VNPEHGLGGGGGLGGGFKIRDDRQVMKVVLGKCSGETVPSLVNRQNAGDTNTRQGGKSGGFTEEKGGRMCPGGGKGGSGSGLGRDYGYVGLLVKSREGWQSIKMKRGLVTTRRGRGKTSELSRRKMRRFKAGLCAGGLQKRPGTAQSTGVRRGGCNWPESKREEVRRGGGVAIADGVG